MKRIALFLALVACVFTLPSCGMANGMAQSAGRLLQSTGRLVGL